MHSWDHTCPHCRRIQDTATLALENTLAILEMSLAGHISVFRRDHAALSCTIYYEQATDTVSVTAFHTQGTSTIRHVLTMTDAQTATLYSFAYFKTSDMCLDPTRVRNGTWKKVCLLDDGHEDVRYSAFPEFSAALPHRVQN
jgi:hypothetical protein